MRGETKDPGTSRRGFEIPLGWRQRQPGVAPDVEKVSSAQLVEEVNEVGSLN